MTNTIGQRQIYTVSELTANIKCLLEEKFSFIWIYGEISNFRIPISGHYYFTLKDNTAQINAVMFRNQNRNLKFVPDDGMNINGLGRISVFEPRGTYQIILEYLEPAGVGAIQLAFEQLRSRLAAEGLFDEKHKKALPYLPKKISIITSPTGAAVHDIIKIVHRRFPGVHIQIIPVRVQGDGADREIVSALEWLTASGDSDVAILARGGGSIEDLHAFNSENVARAIFSSNIPIISAIGHETDFTIADFISDFRAPTPSAAAECVVPLRDDLAKRCHDLSFSLQMTCFRRIEYLRRQLDQLTNRLVSPKKHIQDLQLKLDDFTFRLVRTFTVGVRQNRERLLWRTHRLQANNPMIQLNKLKEKLEQLKYNLLLFIRINIDKKYSSLRETTSRLHGLSPAVILNRGYSITRTIPEAAVVTDAGNISIGQHLHVTLAKGSLQVTVKNTIKTG